MLKIQFVYSHYSVGFVGEPLVIYATYEKDFYCAKWKSTSDTNRLEGQKLNEGEKIFYPKASFHHNATTYWLQIDFLTLADEGIYSCGNHSDQGFYFNIYVYNPVPNPIIKPHLFESDQNNCNFTLECTGAEDAELIWWVKESYSTYSSNDQNIYYSDYLSIDSDNISLSCHVKFNTYVKKVSKKFFPYNNCFSEIKTSDPLYSIENESKNVNIIVFCLFMFFIIILIMIWSAIRLVPYVNNNTITVSSFKTNFILFLLILIGKESQATSNCTESSTIENKLFEILLITLVVLFALTGFFVILKLCLMIAIKIAEYLDRKNDSVKIHLNDY